MLFKSDDVIILMIVIRLKGKNHKNYAWNCKQYQTRRFYILEFQTQITRKRKEIFKRSLR